MAFSRDTARDLRKALEKLQPRKAPRAGPRSALQSRRTVDLGHRSQRAVHLQGPDRQHRGPQQPRSESGTPATASTFEGFPMVVLVNRYQRQRQRDRLRLPPGPQAGGGRRRADVGQRERAERHRAGRRPTACLKLTTAGYRRPSGKNIDRFPDSKESDEWGVMPDQGYEVKLSDRRDGQPARRSPRPRHRPAPEQPSGRKAQREGRKAQREKRRRQARSDCQNARRRKPEPAKTRFVDRQLQKALEYLTVQLARAGK